MCVYKHLSACTSLAMRVEESGLSPAYRVASQGMQAYLKLGRVYSSLPARMSQCSWGLSAPAERAGKRPGHQQMMLACRWEAAQQLQRNLLLSLYEAGSDASKVSHSYATLLATPSAPAQLCTSETG